VRLPAALCLALTVCAGCANGASHFTIKSRLVGRSLRQELARRLSGARFHLWHGGHEFSYFEHHASEILGFYAAALARC